MAEEIETKTPKSKLRLILIISGGIVMLCFCIIVAVGLFSTDDDPDTIAADVTDTTSTSAPASDDQPTDVPLPTDPPSPTDPPPPTAPPEFTFEPITFTGSGDSVIAIEKNDDPTIIHITGNSSSSYFGVTTFGANGEQYDLLVNTTIPYDGILPLDFLDGETTTRIQITASGDWTIEILPLSSARQLIVPGGIQGTGDEVIFIIGSPDIAAISGNAGSNYFGVLSYGLSGVDLLVNTTDPYTGAVIVGSDVFVLQITATGEWAIEITE